MRTLAVTAVFQTGAVPDDGSDLLAPTAQTLSVQQYTDCRVEIAAVDSAGAAFDITGGAFVFTAKIRPQDAEPVISLEADIDDGAAGLAHLTIGSVNVSIAAKSYGWNLVFMDSTGYTWPVVAEGVFAVPPSEYIPGQDVQVPESQQPLAQGPPGINWRGLWSESAAYAARDGVQYADPNGGGSALSSFVALEASVNVPPLDEEGELSSKWDYLAERGGKGANGAGLGVVSWTAERAWDEVYADIQANGGDATVVMGNGYDPNQPPGAYVIPADAEIDINNVRFFSPTGWGLFTMLAGAKLIPKSNSAAINLDGVVIQTKGSITDPGLTIGISTHGYAGISHDAVSEPCFPQVALLSMTISNPLATTFYQFNTASTVELASGATAYIFMYGAGYVGSQSIVGGPATVFLTVDPAGVGYLTKNLIRGKWDALGGSVTLSGTSPVVYVAPVAIDSSQFDNASAFVANAPIGFHPTKKTLQVGDGTSWLNVCAPRMTTTERNALGLGGGDGGITIFNTSIGKGQMWNGSTWNDLW